MDFEAILTEAHNAAREAQRGMTEGHGFDCGFAWVKIVGTLPLAQYCRKQLRKHGTDFPDMNRMVREQRYGHKGWPTGWSWHCPGNFRGQSVGVHEKGASAFRDVLAKHGIVADVHSRLD